MNSAHEHRCNNPQNHIESKKIFKNIHHDQVSGFIANVQG